MTQVLSAYSNLLPNLDSVLDQNFFFGPWIAVFCWRKVHRPRTLVFRILVGWKTKQRTATLRCVSLVIDEMQQFFIPYFTQNQLTTFLKWWFCKRLFSEISRLIFEFKITLEMHFIATNSELLTDQILEKDQTRFKLYERHTKRIKTWTKCLQNYDFVVYRTIP